MIQFSIDGVAEDMQDSSDSLEEGKIDGDKYKCFNILNILEVN